MCFPTLSSGNIIKDIICLFFIQSHGASVDLRGYCWGHLVFKGSGSQEGTEEDLRQKEVLGYIFIIWLSFYFVKIRLIGTLLQCLTFCSLCFFSLFVLFWSCAGPSVGVCLGVSTSTKQCVPNCFEVLTSAAVVAVSASSMIVTLLRSLFLDCVHLPAEGNFSCQWGISRLKYQPHLSLEILMSRTCLYSEGKHFFLSFPIKNLIVRAHVQLPTLDDP